jgi:signal transduction histidine kinase
VAQHDRLVSVLRQRNRELEGRRELVAAQERLHERLRIARDMHDSLGQRLSLVSVQAAALEVSDLPGPQRVQVGQLAQAARGALAELHEVVGALRREPASGPAGLAEVGALVDEFVAAGVPVTRHEDGPAGSLAGSGGQAAYRVVQEGLTNAARHAAGAPVTVRLRWEPDALLVTVTNPAPGPARPAGHGLTGLAERIELAGGLLEHRHGDGGFRLVAMLPTLVPEPTELDDPTTRRRSLVLGVVTAVLMFVVLPAGLLLGVR